MHWEALEVCKIMMAEDSDSTWNGLRRRVLCLKFLCCSAVLVILFHENYASRTELGVQRVLHGYTSYYIRWPAEQSNSELKDMLSQVVLRH